MHRTHITTAAAILVVGATALGAQGPSASASIEVTGGPRAGKYSLASPPDVGCMISERGGKKKTFSLTMGIPENQPRAKDPTAWTMLVVNIRDASGKGPAPEGQYLATVSFGPVMDTRVGTFYMSGSNLTSGQKGGPGSVILQNNGKDADVSLDLQPVAGVTIKGRVTCRNPLRY